MYFVRRRRRVNAPGPRPPLLSSDDITIILVMIAPPSASRCAPFRQRGFTAVAIVCCRAIALKRHAVQRDDRCSIRGSRAPAHHISPAVLLRLPRTFLRRVEKALSAGMPPLRASRVRAATRLLETVPPPRTSAATTGPASQRSPELLRLLARILARTDLPARDAGEANAVSSTVSPQALSRRITGRPGVAPRGRGLTGRRVERNSTFGPPC